MAEPAAPDAGDVPIEDSPSGAARSARPSRLPPLDSARVPLALSGDSAIWLSNFRRLVLGCIDSYDCEQRRIFLHFSRSTRFAFFCTFGIPSGKKHNEKPPRKSHKTREQPPLQSQILQIFRNFFRENFRIFSDFCKILLNFCEISAKINKILTQICKISDIRMVQKDANLVDFEKCCEMRLFSLS